MQDFLRATESQGIPTTDDLEDLVTGQYVNSLALKVSLLTDYQWCRTLAEMDQS